LIALPHVIDAYAGAYAGDDVVLHMAAPATMDERAVTKLLDGFEVEVESVDRDRAATF